MQGKWKTQLCVGNPTDGLSARDECEWKEEAWSAKQKGDHRGHLMLC